MTTLDEGKDNEGEEEEEEKRGERWVYVVEDTQGVTER